MLFERFEDEGLSQYSYALGCEHSRSLAIVDPRRDVDVYLRYAADRGLVLTHVLETHIHADYASGAHELAHRAGASVVLSAYDAGETFTVRSPHRAIRDGELLEIGSVWIRAVHTPGHTPEHISFLVFDTSRSRSVPLLMLSGDFLFVGALGRPDLLGDAATHGLARRLFASVRATLTDLPDGLEVHPAHGAGSLCGAGMSGRPSSTLGYERRTNPYLDPGLGEDDFVARIVQSAPPLPPYYPRMKRLNSDGPPILDGVPGLAPLSLGEFRRLAAVGHAVIDLRDPLAFGGGHVPGAFGIGGGPRVSSWAGWIVPHDLPLLLVAEDTAVVEQAARSLIRVGLDAITGHLAGGMGAWIEGGAPLAALAQLPPSALAAGVAEGSLHVLDVRQDEEWQAGHIAGAQHVMAGTLPARLTELPGPDQAIAVVCGSGYRSTLAASVLERAGYTRLHHLAGGMAAWQRAGMPVTR